MKNKILLIAFKFAPYSEVGAYRWAKFCKYLSDKNFIIHVVTVKWNNTVFQSWHNDVDNDNIVIHRIPSNYPHNLKYKKFKKNIIGFFLTKIRNQFLKFLNLFYYIDDAQYWGKNLISYCNKLINNENIKLIIATGAPFMTNYWASQIKINNPQIKLIQDLRDEWNEFRNFKFNFQKNKSIYYERFALNNCNAVVATSYGLMDLFSKKITDKNIKCPVIYNGFDEESLNKINFKNKKIDRDFSFIFAGSLSNDRISALYLFLDAVKDNINKFKNIKIKIFSPDCNLLSKKYKDLLNINLFLYDYVSQDKLFNEIYNSFIAIHCMPDTQKFIISIKLFEYAMLTRPVLSLNSGGDTEDLIKKYSLGYSVDYKNKDLISKTLFNIYKLWQSDHSYVIKTKNLNVFSYKNLAVKYKDLILETLND